jgi:hypothetical protein
VGTGGHRRVRLLALGTAALLAAACGPGPQRAAPVHRAATHRRAAPTTTTEAPGASTTTTAPAPTWPQHEIVPTRVYGVIDPTSSALYWLTGSQTTAACPRTESPVRYDMASGTVTDGPSISGCTTTFTVTAGLVWLAEEEGTSLTLEALNATTMAVVETRTFPIDTTHAAPSSPTLAATVDGPLWATDGKVVWALDPSTGAVESQFTPGVPITAMATGATGSTLYLTGRRVDAYGAYIAEYAISSEQLLAETTLPDATAPPQLAAGEGVLWASYRGGNAGGAAEFSSQGLAPVPHPSSPPNSSGFGNAFDDIGGVDVGITDRALWLDDHTDIFCADPSTGAVRAGEANPGNGLGLPVLDGGRAYAPLTAGGIVALAPPAACFGSP